MILFFALCFVGVAIAGFCAFVIFWPLTLVHVRDRHAALGAQWGEGANLTTIDGVRVDYAKGWGLVRASNTTPVLVLRFEADTEAELQRIKDVFHAQLKRVAPDLQLPF